VEKRCFEATRKGADGIGRESAHVWRHAKFQRSFRPRSIASALSTSRGYASDSLRKVASVHSSCKEKMRQVANLCPRRKRWTEPFLYTSCSARWEHFNGSRIHGTALASSISVSSEKGWIMMPIHCIFRVPCQSARDHAIVTVSTEVLWQRLE
jgi:hypothetical protein